MVFLFQVVYQFLRGALVAVVQEGGPAPATAPSGLPPGLQTEPLHGTLLFVAAC